MEKINNSFDYSSIATNPGAHIEPIYSKVFNEELKKDLVQKTGETDVHESIIEANNTSDINLLKKMLSNGQAQYQDDPTAIYGIDTGKFPDNIHDVYKQVSEAQKTFEALPDTVKNIFGNYEAFRLALLDGSYSDRVINGLSKIAEDNKDPQPSEPNKGENQ